jgi:bifunctional non-homologous end joining protein LigD
VLFAHGEDVRVLSLKERKAILDNVVLRYGLEKTDPFIGEGRPLFNAVCRLDLEGIVAKRMDDGYGPKAQWFKILNPSYSQKEGRAELFERRYG